MKERKGKERKERHGMMMMMAASRVAIAVLLLGVIVLSWETVGVYASTRAEDGEFYWRLDLFSRE